MPAGLPSGSGNPFSRAQRTPSTPLLSPVAQPRAGKTDSSQLLDNHRAPRSECPSPSLRVRPARFTVLFSFASPQRRAWASALFLRRAPLKPPLCRAEECAPARSDRISSSTHFKGSRALGCRTVWCVSVGGGADGRDWPPTRDSASPERVFCFPATRLPALG